jgi:hypothetical protein
MVCVSWVNSALVEAFTRRNRGLEPSARPWFRSVESLGWDWIGRVRNVVQYRAKASHTWRETTSLYYKATRKPASLGWCWLSRKHPYGCYLHLYKALSRAPGRARKRRGPVNAAKRTQAREPWLLATSLSPHTWSARRIVNAYDKRMHIEETFRDSKNQRWGYGLQHSRSRRTQRLEVLLLLSALAMLTTWLVGLAATHKSWQRHFQANTEKKRNVLSIFFLGRRVLHNTRLKLSRGDLDDAFDRLPYIVNQCAQHS